jgi:hypothetical protein
MSGKENSAVEQSGAGNDTEVMTVIVTSIGAVLATLLGVLAGSILSSRSQRRQWSRDRQADACAHVLRESSNIVIELARLTWHPPDPAPDGLSVPTSMDWKAWNEALAMISLVGDHRIVEAAQAIDAQIWPVHQQIKRGWSPAGGWPQMREPIDARRQDFVNIARQHLAPPGPPLRRITGRPAADDPFWQFRRSYFAPDDQRPAAVSASTQGSLPQSPIERPRSPS